MYKILVKDSSLLKLLLVALGFVDSAVYKRNMGILEKCPKTKKLDTKSVLYMWKPVDYQWVSKLIQSPTFSASSELQFTIYIENALDMSHCAML